MGTPRFSFFKKKAFLESGPKGEARTRQSTRDVAAVVLGRVVERGGNSEEGEDPS